ncbi:MAG: hypothetical protein AAFN18_21150 [Cyanobacteria bacterium J06554_6]
MQYKVLRNGKELIIGPGELRDSDQIVATATVFLSGNQMECLKRAAKKAKGLQ